MVALMRDRSISTWFVKVLSAAMLLFASENKQRIAMIVILESTLYKLNSPATNKICDITNQKCSDIHGDNC